MTGAPHLREATADDLAALRAPYRAAFPDEDLIALVEELTGDPSTLVGLVATDPDTRVIAHVHFSRCSVAGMPVALLAPLAVSPVQQRQGIGQQIVRSGFDHLTSMGLAHVLVLGDPGYYARFGFRREDTNLPPYPLPDSWDGAWQSRALGAAGVPARRGTLGVPGPWQRAALWQP